MGTKFQFFSYQPACGRCDPIYTTYRIPDSECNRVVQMVIASGSNKCMVYRKTEFTIILSGIILLIEH